MARRDFEFFPNKLLYLFSFDLDLGRKRRDVEFNADSGVRPVLTSMAQDFHDVRPEDRPPVYHALGEARVLSEQALTGWVEFAQDRIRYLPRQYFADIFGRLAIRTQDEQLVEADYEGVARAGRGWLTVHKDYAQGDPDKTVEVKAYIQTRFETGSTKYRWLTQRQCVGYGRLSLRRGEPSFSTFDIYAMTS